MRKNRCPVVAMPRRDLDVACHELSYPVRCSAAPCDGDARRTVEGPEPATRSRRSVRSTARGRGVEKLAARPPHRGSIGTGASAGQPTLVQDAGESDRRWGGIHLDWPPRRRDCRERNAARSAGRMDVQCVWLDTLSERSTQGYEGRLPDVGKGESAQLDPPWVERAGLDDLHEPSDAAKNTPIGIDHRLADPRRAPLARAPVDGDCTEADQGAEVPDPLAGVSVSATSPRATGDAGRRSANVRRPRREKEA